MAQRARARGRRGEGGLRCALALTFSNLVDRLTFIFSGALESGSWMLRQGEGGRPAVAGEWAGRWLER